MSNHPLKYKAEDKLLIRVNVVAAEDTTLPYCIKIGDTNAWLGKAELECCVVDLNRKFKKR